MKLLTIIIGARPQFIKIAPFSEAFRKSRIETLYILVNTMTQICQTYSLINRGYQNQIII